MPQNEQREPQETDALLAAGLHQPATTATETTTPRDDTPSESHARTRCQWPWLRVVILMIAVAIVSDIGESLFAAPKVRLLEDAACRQYYDQPHIPEHLCKVDAVQEELAQLLGLQQLFDSIPAILLPIPWCNLADRRGRKWIAVLALSGFTLSYAWTLLAVGAFHLPPRAVWLSSAFFLIGGGPTVATTLLTTMIADVVPPETRSTVFFYRFCTDLVADVAIPPLASYLMSRNLWIPLIGAALFQGLCALLFLTVPETAPWPARKEENDAESSEGSISTTSSIAESKRPSPWDKHLQDLIYKIKTSFRFVTAVPAVGPLVFTFLISKIGRQSTNILFQYASKRYDWTLSQAGLLSSLRAAVNIVLFILILPTLAAFLLRRVSGPGIRDLLLARGSIVLLLLGTLILAFSVNSALMIIGLISFTLGAGYPPTARSLVTLQVESHSVGTSSDIGRLYALITVLEGIGNLVAAVGMSSALRLGIRWGEPWLGLPFAFAAVLFALVAVIVFRIRRADV